MEYSINYNHSTGNYDIVFDDGCIWTASNYSEADETAQAYIAALSIQVQEEVQQAEQAHTCDLDWTLMQVIIEEAKAKVKHDKRWTNAINRAERELKSNPHMHYDGVLTIESSSGKRYTVDSDHSNECIAASQSKPCWHRAASRLMQRYTESRNVPQKELDRLNAIAEMMECFE